MSHTKTQNMKLISSLTRRYLSFVVFFNLLLINNINAQSPSVCPIGVGTEPKRKTELRPGSLFNEIRFGLSPVWSNLSYMKFSDDKKAEMTLNGITRSRQILGNNFKFQIPEGATINGIMLMVEGSSKNYKSIDELEIFLVDKEGEPKGQNKSNEAKLQKAWSKKSDGGDHSWMYGSDKDTWGTSWTPDEINDPNFGFQIHVRNIDNSINSVAIDQVTILVDYTPAYSFCDDNCLTFFIDKYDKNGSYEWIPVNGFRLVSHTFNHQTIDLKVNEASFGLYNICVNVYDKSGKFVEKCCRNFLYQDCKSSEMEGIVWSDLNDNDIRDIEDRIIAGSPVYLYTKDHKPVDTVLTDAYGKYRFGMAEPGEYFIKVPALIEKKFVLFSNLDPDNNSDITNAFGPGTTDLIQIEIGRRYEGIDLGYKPVVTIGNYVWEDNNYNGLQDEDESGLSGIKIFLLKQNLTIIDSVVSDQNGLYRFANVNANKYRVKFSTLSGFRPTWFNNSDNDKNSKVDSTGISGLLTFIDSGSRLNIDAGYYKPATIGDLVWEDKNGNGLIDIDDSGVPNIKLTLTGLAGDGQRLNRDVFSSNQGKYYFSNLPPGKYDIRVQPGDDYVFTTPNAGSDNIDSDVVNGKIADITLKSRDSLLNFDAGIYKYAKVGDFVWDDKNANGIQDVGESGVPGISITLSQIHNNIKVVAKIFTTSQDGFYLFDSLMPGRYFITIQKPEEFNLTPVKIGIDRTKDSDYTENEGISIMLMSGEENRDADIGLFRLGKVGNFVWEDKNANGIQDLGENGISGIKVTLTGRDYSKDTITDANGLYLFEKLKPGKYQLSLHLSSDLYVFTLPNVGADDTKDSDAVNGSIAPFIIDGGQTDLSKDFGLVKYIEIGDYIWEDQDADGIQDANELPVAGVEVKLSGTSFEKNPIDLRVTSNVQGKYLFNKVLPGKYDLSINIPSGYTPTKYSKGENRNLDSNLPENGRPFTIEITESVDNLSFDFGLLRLGSVGDLVWEDLNCDKQRQLIEPGLAGVSVMLSGHDIFNTDVNRLQVTDAFGHYYFSSLKPGTYTVTFTTPQGFESTESLVRVITITSGSLIENIDIPFFKRTSVGDFVWDDVNGNGIQDTGEPGISSASVTLSGVSDATFAQVSTTTDASGHYKFDNLKPGTYNIVFGQVTLKNLTNPKVGADDGKDSDPVLGGQVSNVTLVSGVPRGDIDAGYVPISTASISGFVWEDLNANGVQDDGESGISNDTVSLKREDGNFSGVIVTVITNQNGRYIFSNLAAGSYSVIFSRPSGFEFTDYDMGDDVKDSDVLPPLGKTSVFTIGFGQSLLNIDAGLFRRGTLGDFVWNDSNGNGLQEGSEPGLSGIMLTLKDETNSDIGSTISDINGKYLFSNIKPAKYRIEAVLPKGYASVPINPLDLSINSDFSPSDSLASTALITVLSGIQNLDIDLGIVIKSRISGIAWKDSNGNGLREEIEPMMDSVIVILLNSTGSELKIDTTDSNGAYLFKDIDAGTYKVKFANMPGMFFTYPNVGSNDSKSSDVIDQSGVTSEFLLMEGLDMANVCVGYVNSSSIGDYIWIDENKNGLQSSDEVGLNGVKIYLLNQSGIVIDSTTSNINNSGSGYYSFSNLIYGQYSVKFSLPQNFDFTILNSSDTLLNSDIVDASAGKTRTITLLPGQMRNDIDAGYTLKAAIAGTINGIVWQDSNNNKFRDGDDSLLSGITVSLFKIDRTLVGTTLSGPDGSYSFSQVAFGDYFVSVPLINDKMFVLKQGNPVPNGSQISNNFGAGSTDLISVLPGNTVSGIDMGYFRKITIGDFVWDDLNNNGLQDTNEPGIGNITISLINEAGLTEKTTTSDNSGQYIISDIGPGRYKVKFSLKPDYVFAKLNSTNDNKNSKVSPINGETPLLDFLTLITYANIDAGYTKAGSVGSRVWLDLNGNGVFQTNEPGIPDIKVKLYSEDGSLADSTITGQDGTSLFSGFYTFSKVRPGKYYIKFEIPANFIISVADVGGDDDVDSDITGMFGSMTTDLFEVSGNQFVKNIDAGVYRPATIGDRVWNDLNMNGIQEFGEPGLANVKVSLHNQSGILLDTTRTNGQGIYSFMNLRQRLYYLQFSLPEGFQFTIQNAPGSNEDDSDVDNAGTTPLISLAHGSNLLQIDAGIFRSSARIVMGKVWNDTNEDGICNTGETYETGVKVYLKDLVTGEVKSSITNHAGRYALITNNVGEHHVVVEAPDDFVFTEKGMGNDYESDSDVNELGISDVLMLTDQYIRKYIDAGYYYKVVSSLNGKVWKDKNHNGLRDDTDSLMQNVVVFLFDKSRIFVKSTKTNSVGEYSFKFLDAGQYYCRIPEFSDMGFVMFTGNNQDKDSEITNQFGVGTSRLITINPGIPLSNFDFGYVDLNRLVVSDPKRIVQYEVFPNPVINEIRVKVPSDILMKTQYNIINNMGRVVKSGTIDGESEILETGHLPSGRYVIQFYNEKERILKTFIKVDN